MKAIRSLALMLIVVTSVNAVFGDFRRRTVEDQMRYCAVVAEIRIDRVYLGRAANDKFDDLFCECTVLQGFKLPTSTNRLILRLNFGAHPRSNYEYRTAMLFAFEHEWGGFTPWGAKQGLILTNETYLEYVKVDSKNVVRKEYKYDELLLELKKITKAKEQAVNQRLDEPEPEAQMSLEDRVAEAKLIVVGRQGFPGPTGRRVNTSVRVEQVLFGSIPTNMTLYVTYNGTSRLGPDVYSRKPMTFPKGGSRWIFFLTDEGLKQPPGTNYYTRAIGQYKYAHDGFELATDESVKQVKELIAKKKK